MGQSWTSLLDEIHALGHGELRLPAYSEFMPAPRVGWRPLGEADPSVRAASDERGWCISEWEQQVELAPGLDEIAAHVVGELERLARGGSHQLSRTLLDGNPAWPDDLAAGAAALTDETFALILPLALSRTQDDKGRVRWTLFGGSHLGPAHAFWRSFQTASGGDGAPGEAEARLARVVAFATGLDEKELLSGGLRVLAAARDPAFPDAAPVPASLARLLVDGDRDDGVPPGTRALVTFRPFAHLPPSVRRAYLDGALRLVPTPASLVFFHHPGYRRLAEELPRATQIPLLHLFPRSSGGARLRVPQSGWLDETPDARQLHELGHKRLAPSVRRTHRWQRVERDGDDHATLFDDRVTRALFSTAPDDLGLYDKPMARNAEVWSHDYRLLLDGPNADRAALERAAQAFAAGGRWGYRFLFPPMRVGSREVFWHLPLVARKAASRVARMPELAGVLVAERVSAPPVELVPRLLARDAERAALELFPHEPGHRSLTTATNIHKLLAARRLLDRALAPHEARQILTLPRGETIEVWLDGLATRAIDATRGARLATQVRALLAPHDSDGSNGDEAHSYALTATREFEERYWRTIATLAEGDLRDKNNADTVVTNSGRRGGVHGHAVAPSVKAAHAEARRDLELVGAWLHRRYDALIDAHDMRGRAVCADHRFAWATEFEYPWSRGWREGQGALGERNVVCVIPGRDRSQAVILADHYDTAYMEDLYDAAKGGDGLRAAASGADDNHSATAALLAAAEVLLPLSKAGELARDVWLVHLTGEEFPADCLGARSLCETLARRELRLVDGNQNVVDLSSTRVVGAFVLDMVAHNNDRDHDVFQIAPGEGAAAARLAVRVHRANRLWNEGARAWNRTPERRGAGRGRRVPDGSVVPAIAEHPILDGQVRPPRDPRSSLYNTDAQIFSDAGVPVVLLMENYDINRAGYHDTHDTMANIDLDYGAALVAIAIETVVDCALSDEI